MKLDDTCFVVDMKNSDQKRILEILSILDIKKEDSRFDFLISKILPKIAARTLLKNIASENLGVPKSKLKFSYGNGGKPYFKNFENFHFNISHTDYAFAVFISNSEAGIDVERKKEINLSIANRFFSEQEKQFFNSYKNKENAFFKIWTRKEAYAKYLGVGFSKDFLESNVFSQNIKTFKRKDLYISVCKNRNEDLDFSRVYYNIKSLKKKIL
ncbi:MAG: 4'-phosphopantetheinyl transferase superfamily protein [Oscillospiraceae bacterium]|jgi:4'-phosphopantetheinyl transferase|nr:4'-phosphopantetheinyl transferase superfamily protein [Oscillospiraceae bacterium]